MPKPQTILALATTAVLALLIGCSGGGGGGGVTGITTGSNGTASSGSNGSGGTSGTNTGGTSAGTTGAPGTLPSNVVFYSEDVVQDGAAATQIRHINPDRTGDTLYASLSEAFLGFGLNPNVQGQVLFGYDPNGSGSYGIFRNASASAEGATVIVPPSYSEIGAISVTPDGASVIYVATPGDGASGLYRVPIGGGTPERLDDADDATLSPSGNLVAYSKLANGAPAADVYIRDLRTATLSQLTNSAAEEVLPNWSRSGNRIVFSRQVGDANYDLFAVDVANGGNETRITSTDNLSEFGASYSGDDAQVSFSVLSAIDPAENGLFRQEASGNPASRFQIKASPAIREDTHWSNFNGRAQHRAVSNLTLRLKKRKAAGAK